MSLDHVTPHPEAAAPALAPARNLAPATPEVAPAPLPAMLLALQRDAGNAAVTSLLVKPRAIERREAIGAPVKVQRNVPPDKSVTLPDNYEAMTDTEKTAVIRDLLAGNPGMVYTAWKKLASPKAVALANPDLFTASMKIDDDLADLSAFDDMRETFKNDVLGKARGYLSSNKGFIQDERDKTGVPKTDDSVGGQVQARVDILSGKGASAETDFAVQDVQRAAEQMEGVKKRKATCLATPVGYSVKLTRFGHYEPVETHVKTVFSPGKPPQDWEPGTPKYDEVMAQWTQLIHAEAQLVKKHPSAAFFIGEGGDPTKLKNEKDIRVARAEIATALADLEGKIDKAVPLVGDDIEFTDLVPIQQQLLGGTPGDSQTIWSKPVEKAIAKETLSDANMWALLATLGVGALSAACFIFSELASGGLATFLWAAAGTAVSAGQAAGSWKDYTDLAAANKASVNPEEMLVSGEQVDDALLSAILDSVFAVVDGWQGFTGAAKVAAGGRALKEGGRAGVAVGPKALLRNLHAAENPAAALAKAVQEVGLEEARKLSGLGFDELAKIAGENTDLGKQFNLLATKGAGAMSDATRDLVTKLPTIATLSAEEGEKVLAASIAQFGYKGTLEKAGGWKALKQTAAMKGGAGSAAALEGWRAGVFKQLAAFMEEESGKMAKAVRTGTEKASSDLDIQVIGETAGQLQQRAEGWLAGRMSTNVDGAKSLLDAEILVDPTRAHLIDLMKDIGEDVRAQINGEMATWEQQLIFGARLNKAKEAGEEAVKKVRAEAAAVNVTPFEGFTPRSASEQKQLAASIDGWMTELKTTTDPGARAALAKKIGKTQAHINASHADAYVGGGVAIWVSGRDVDIAKIAEALNIDPSDLAKVTAAKRISAALSEGKWLDAAVQQLQNPKGATGRQLTAAVNNIGKHGARAAQVLKVEGKTNVGRLSALMETLEGYRYMEVGQLEKLVKQGDLAALRGELTGLLDALSTATSSAITALQKDAGAIGVSLADMAEFQSWLKWQATYQGLTSFAREATAAEVRALETALQELKQSSDQSVSPGFDYPAPPNQSVAPPAEVPVGPTAGP